jgi:phage terminase large subunit-like protein
MLMFGLRLGDDPRAVVTTTPKPIKIIRELIADPTTVITRGSTYDNRANLAPAFLQQIVRKYEGTRLGRQELNAEILDDVPGALWSRADRGDALASPSKDPGLGAGDTDKPFKDVPRNTVA